MTELELIGLWTRARWHVIVSQLGPTALLGFTVWLAMEGLGDASLAVRIAAAGILLASGILGALAQFSAASEARSIAAALAALERLSPVSSRIVDSARWTDVVRFVTPAVFVVIYLALLAELFLR